MLASTLLISAGPKPVTVLLCLGLVIPAGPTGPKSDMGADELGLRSRGVVVVVEAMLGRQNTTQCVGGAECKREGIEVSYVECRSCLLSSPFPFPTEPASLIKVSQQWKVQVMYLR